MLARQVTPTLSVSQLPYLSARGDNESSFVMCLRFETQRCNKKVHASWVVMVATGAEMGLEVLVGLSLHPPKSM